MLYFKIYWSGDIYSVFFMTRCHIKTFKTFEYPCIRYPLLISYIYNSHTQTTFIIKRGNISKDIWRFSEYSQLCTTNRTISDNSNNCTKKIIGMLIFWSYIIIQDFCTILSKNQKFKQKLNDTEMYQSEYCQLTLQSILNNCKGLCYCG